MKETNTRQKIIDTVIRLYSQHSYEGISTKHIVEETGIGTGTLYWHFAKKEDIFTEAFEQCYQKTVEHLRIGIDDNASAIDCLKQRLKNMVDFNKKEPHCIHFLVKHMPMIAKQVGKPGVAFPFKKELYSDVAKYIQKGLVNKEIVDLPEEFLCSVVIYNINSEFLEYLNRNPEYYENEPLVDKMIDSLYNAIKRF